MAKKQEIISQETYLTLKNYKEPLVKIKKKDGFGYYGAILCSKDGKFIQCHICGKLYADAGCHARQKHKINHQDYREKYGLAYTTSLLSESERQRRKESTLAWLRSLTVGEREAMKQKAIRNSRKAWRDRKKFQPILQLETRNKRGTCPTQLLDKIKEVAEENGHTPSLKEFIWATGGQRYKHLIFTVFGSWLNALKLAKLAPVEVRSGGWRKYGDDELLEYIKIYYQENNKIPTSTDCNRGLLPSECVFRRRFGGLPAARKLAGIKTED